jgi:hypothetical protein
MEIGDREVLVARHGARIRRVQHGAAVAQRPGRAAWHLLTDETVFHDQPVVRKRLFVEEMPELSVEGFVLVAVVAHLEQTAFHSKGVAEIITDFVLGDLWCPVLQILAVEKDEPVLLVGVGIANGGLCMGGKCN